MGLVENSPDYAEGPTVSPVEFVLQKIKSYGLKPSEVIEQMFGTNRETITIPSFGDSQLGTDLDVATEAYAEFLFFPYLSHVLVENNLVFPSLERMEVRVDVPTVRRRLFAKHFAPESPEPTEEYFNAAETDITELSRHLVNNATQLLDDKNKLIKDADTVDSAREYYGDTAYSPYPTNLDGDRVWAVHLPNSKISTIGNVPGFSMPAGAGGWLLVTDPAARAEATRMAVTSPSLMDLYFAQFVVQQTRQRMQVFDESLKSMVAKRDTQIFTEIVSLNRPSQLHGYNLLYAHFRDSGTATLLLKPGRKTMPATVYVKTTGGGIQLSWDAEGMGVPHGLCKSWFVWSPKRDNFLINLDEYAVPQPCSAQKQREIEDDIIRITREFLLTMGAVDAATYVSLRKDFGEQGAARTVRMRSNELVHTKTIFDFFRSLGTADVFEIIT